MKKNLVSKIVSSVSILSGVCMSVLFFSCSNQQKGYSASINKSPEEKSVQQDSIQGFISETSSAIIQDDADFFDLIAKIESGEFVPEPPRNEEVPENLESEQTKILIPEGKILEIKEKMFLTQINDIYFNFDSYKEKTIIAEGIYTELVSYIDNSTIPALYRRGPGCCGNDGWGGFMLDWNGKIPNENDWIRVSGKPYIKEYKGYEDLYLKVETLEVKKERGAEFVNQ